jgi:GAF domain-containing protein
MPPMSLDRVTASITGAVRRISQPDATLDTTLEAIAFAARDSIPGFDLAGISTVDPRGRTETRAVTDPMVLQFDELQYRFDEGPCIDALGSAHVVSVPRIRHEQRWPRYVPEVVRLGLRSQLAVKLSVDDEGTLGGVNLYSTLSDEIPAEAESIAELFALHAASALGSAVRIEQLNQAMHTRKVIGQALGILMERYAMDEERAFRFLVRASQTGNAKIRDIAQELVDRSNRGDRDHG